MGMVGAGVIQRRKGDGVDGVGRGRVKLHRLRGNG